MTTISNSLVIPFQEPVKEVEAVFGADQLQNLHSVLQQHKLQSLTLTTSQDLTCRYSMESKPWFSRLFSFWRPYNSNAIHANIQTLLHSLKVNPSLGKSREIRDIFQSFAKSCQQKAKSKPSIYKLSLRLEKALYASRMGFSLEVFEKHPSFHRFAKGNFLHRFKQLYPDCFRIDENNDPWIQVSLPGITAKEIHWSELHSLMQGQDAPIQVDKNLYLEKHRFMAGKLVPWNYQKWGNSNGVPSIPYKETANPPPWGNRSFIDIRTCTNQKNPRYTFDHTWFNLRTDDGKTYSYGFFRPDKRSKWEHLDNPGCTKNGYWQCPDISDITVDEEEIHSTPFEISKEELEKCKQWIESKQGTDFDLYNLVEYNCSDKIAELLVKLGIRMESKIPIADDFLPVGLCRVSHETTIDECTKMCQPENKPLHLRIYEKCVGIIFASCFGGTKIHKDVTHPTAKPLFQNVSEIFSKRMESMSHPFVVFLWGRDIMKYRQEKMQPIEKQIAEKKKQKSAAKAKIKSLSAEIEALEQKLEKVRYCVPERFCCPKEAF